MIAESFSTIMVLVGPVEVGTPSKKDQSPTWWQTCRNSSLMACRVPVPGTSSLTNAFDPDPMDMVIRVVTKALESAPRCGVPRKYKLCTRLAMSA